MILSHFQVGGASYYRRLPKLNQTVLEYNDEHQRNRIRALQSVDDMIGNIIAKLNATSQLEYTYIIFTSDNGYHLSQHRLYGGKRCGLETDIRIPFAIRGPGVKANWTNEAVSNHVDVSPTLLALAGIEHDYKLDGAIIPVNPALKRKARWTVSRELTNVEHWGPALAEGLGNLSLSSSLAVGPGNLSNLANTGREYSPDNTFYSVRVIGDCYSFYYSVWCTNEHEVYDMAVSDHFGCVKRVLIDPRRIRTNWTTSITILVGKKTSNSRVATSIRPWHALTRSSSR